MKNWKGRCQSCAGKKVGFTDRCRKASIESLKNPSDEKRKILSDRAKENWNSDEYRNKISNTMKNKYLSGYHNYNWKGDIHDKCMDCGKTLSSRLHVPKRCRSCYGISRIGKKIPAYVGDKISAAKRKVFGNKYPQSELRKKRREYNAWHKNVFDRDGNKCVICGSTEKLEAHHIKEVCMFPELIYNIDNGLTLCRECHKKTDNYGINFYNNITHTYRSEHP